MPISASVKIYQTSGMNLNRFLKFDIPEIKRNIFENLTILEQDAFRQVSRASYETFWEVYRLFYTKGKARDQWIGSVFSDLCISEFCNKNNYDFTAGLLPSVENGAANSISQAECEKSKRRYPISHTYFQWLLTDISDLLSTFNHFYQFESNEMTEPRYMLELTSNIERHQKDYLKLQEHIGQQSELNVYFMMTPLPLYQGLPSLKKIRSFMIANLQRFLDVLTRIELIKLKIEDEALEKDLRAVQEYNDEIPTLLCAAKRFRKHEVLSKKDSVFPLTEVQYFESEKNKEMATRALFSLAHAVKKIDRVFQGIQALRNINTPIQHLV